VKCPSCNSPIYSKQRDQLFYCDKCNVLHTRNGGVEKLDFEIAEFSGSPSGERVFVPFWRLYCSFIIRSKSVEGGHVFRLMSWTKDEDGSGTLFIHIPAADFDPSTFKKFRKRVNFRGLDDIRVRVLGGQRLQLGAVTGYITDRDQNDGDKLRGWGNVEGGLVLGAYSAFSVGEIQFDAAILEKVTGDDSGFEMRFGVETTQKLTERTTIVARVGTTFGSEDYMQTYFGITPTQAARSKAAVPVYSADAGIKDVFLQLGATVALSDRWLLKAGGRYGRLLGEAADSPIVETENQLSAVLGLGYRFNLPR
ncbi:MAG: MipA/OmpV family protein, partial [Methyloceanibacter sp.]